LSRESTRARAGGTTEPPKFIRSRTARPPRKPLITPWNGPLANIAASHLLAFSKLTLAA